MSLDDHPPQAVGLVADPVLPASNAPWLVEVGGTLVFVMVAAWLAIRWR